MKNNNENPKLQIAIPVRMNEALINDIDEVAEHLDISKQEAMRFCIKIGIKHLKNIGYEVHEAVVEKSQSKVVRINDNDSSSVVVGSKNKIKTKVKKEK